ncbi:glutathione S-transferase [Pseudosulfitobacter pseudonitzschiae]|uniref:Glutathione S-transferase n=1 Tax=Pseudosulfitobacter pseudonitzschiae TaxID=1402135 RepID=A0A073J4F2_9RHOB|nr:glutathione S-transferase [Pseudosulfitobacter pseudonitzschiae]KEJ96874.1 glutathione S-transferase [Pseudosulfitobacter pseudonitzschiae]QKS07201.1 glutathione S-transferase [Pseudosulfitobacter pseudonitzschiae]SHF45363.1 glutathione S-transferase [Pseudosulfitobacter pseudonitzschiae]
MKLLMSGASPFVRKVLVVLRETQQLDDVEIVNVTTAPGATPAELAAANPIGKIPALVRNGGATLYDSRVITRFLDDRAKAGLYPATNPWETLTLEATGDAIMEAAVSMVYERRLRDPAQQSDTWVENQWEKVSRGLDALDNRWMAHLHGPLDIGHIAVGCALGYLDFRHEDRNWRKGRDALAAWAAKFNARDSMQATVP